MIKEGTDNPFEDAEHRSSPSFINASVYRGIEFMRSKTRGALIKEKIDVRRLYERELQELGVREKKMKGADYSYLVSRLMEINSEGHFKPNLDSTEMVWQQADMILEYPSYIEGVYPSLDAMLIAHWRGKYVSFAPRWNVFLHVKQLMEENRFVGYPFSNDVSALHENFVRASVMSKTPFQDLQLSEDPPAVEAALQNDLILLEALHVDQEVQKLTEHLLYERFVAGAYYLIPSAEDGLSRRKFWEFLKKRKAEGAYKKGFGQDTLTEDIMRYRLELVKKKKNQKI